MTFNADLAFANASEAYLLAKYPKIFGPAQNRTHDLVLLKTGEMVELKTERKGAEAPNLFFELVANDNKQTLGGPARAAADGIAYFLIMHAPCKTLYVFQTDKLLQRLNELVKSKKPKVHKIFNGGYNTLGVALEKSLFLDLNIGIIGLEGIK